MKLSKNEWLILFPSPYGVSFILIGDNPELVNYWIGVGFRLLTEYHSFLYSATHCIR